MTRRFITTPIAAAALALAVLSGGTNALATTPTPVATAPPDEPTEPAPVEPVATTPIEIVGPPVEDDGTDWMPIILIGFGIVLLIAVIAALASRSSRKPASPASPGHQQPASTAQINLLTTAQWIHDQLSLELLGAEPVAAQQRWLTERSRVDDVVIGCQQQFASHHGSGWQQLGQQLATLAAAIDTNVHLRVQPGADASLVSESNAVVNRQRATLLQMLTALWSATPR